MANTYITSYLVAIAMFDLSFTIYEIFTKQIKWTQFDLENEVRDQRDEKLDLRHSPGNY